MVFEVGIRVGIHKLSWFSMCIRKALIQQKTVRIFSEQQYNLATFELQ